MKDMNINNNRFFDFKGAVILVLLLLLSNLATYTFWLKPAREPTGGSGEYDSTMPVKKRSNLYLIDQADAYVYDLKAFEKKIRKVSKRLDVPAEWLMSVIHSESRFDASVANFKGSGAVGLIQFMPATAKDYNVSTERLRNMNHVEQLDFVYQYLNVQKKRYGNYESLTDMYLAILYPKAMGEDFCYTLYAKPSKAYKMNSGLDEDKDGRVTVSDIDRRMKRVYPKAYMTNKDDGTATPSIDAESVIERFKANFGY